MSNDLPLLIFLERYNRAEQLIMNLHEGNNREEVLNQLKNLIIQHSTEAMRMNLGFQLWNSKVTMTILLQEVIRVYPKFEASTLTMRESTRLCNALYVIQCMASHSTARMGIVEARIAVYLLPFLEIPTTMIWPLQFVRISVLELIAALAKFDEPYGLEILLLLLQTNVFSSCLPYINYGDRLLRKVATLILMKILMQEQGLHCCIALPERFLSAIQALGQLVQTFVHEFPCSQHLKYVVQCYLSLSRVACAGGVYEAVRTYFPGPLIDNTFQTIIHEDPEIPNMLHQLVWNLNPPPPQ